MKSFKSIEHKGSNRIQEQCLCQRTIATLQRIKTKLFYFNFDNFFFLSQETFLLKMSGEFFTYNILKAIQYCIFI